MIKNLKSIGVLLTNLIICIGAGHGFGPIILMEIFSIYSLFLQGEVAFNDANIPHFSFNNSYEDMITYFLLFSFIGQVIFLVSYLKFWKKKIKKIFRTLGILLMLFGFILISKNMFDDGLAVFSFITGLPFLYFVILEIKFSLND